MVERPILFQGAMVRAILDGRKTETRRLASNKQAARIEPGDMLWVRETWTARMNGGWTIADARSGLYQNELLYRADGHEAIDGWWPSLHMPREFSRILLRVTAVHVEALQDISEEGAKAEGACRIGENYIEAGFKSFDDGPNFYSFAIDGASLNAPTAAGAYALLWDIINPKNPWESNPSVRVIQFEKVKP